MIITRAKLRKRRQHRKENHRYNKEWVFQYSIQIMDFDAAREILNHTELNMTAWQVNGGPNKNNLSFLFRSRLKMKDVFIFLSEKFHKTLHQDF